MRGNFILERGVPHKSHFRILFSIRAKYHIKILSCHNKCENSRRSTPFSSITLHSNHSIRWQQTFFTQFFFIVNSHILNQTAHRAKHYPKRFSGNEHNSNCNHWGNESELSLCLFGISWNQVHQDKKLYLLRHPPHPRNPFRQLHSRI